MFILVVIVEIPVLADEEESEESGQGISKVLATSSASSVASAGEHSFISVRGDSLGVSRGGSGSDMLVSCGEGGSNILGEGSDAGVSGGDGGLRVSDGRGGLGVSGGGGGLDVLRKRGSLELMVSDAADSNVAEGEESHVDTRHGIKRRWSEEEVGIFKKAFKDNILNKAMPSGSELKEVQKQLSHRSVSQIRTRLNNIILGKQKH
jgi:hypothetical protein